MGQSLKQRFNGESQEVLQYARQFGIWAAMEQYEVKDYVAMLNFLKGMAPDETFGQGHDEYDSFADPRAFDHLVEATQRYIAKLEIKNAELARDNQRLKAELENKKKMRWNSTRPIIENLNEQINKGNIDFA